MFSFILDIVSTNLQHENENKKMDTGALDLHEIKRVDQILYVQTFYYSLIKQMTLPFFVIINGNILKQVAVTAKLLHSTTLTLRKAFYANYWRYCQVI